jgi:hypothetical protein
MFFHGVCVMKLAEPCILGFVIGPACGTVAAGPGASETGQNSV